ncbi:MAG: hypothetical protein JNN08_31820 [Bryobacterales bacterium]|nr:hypothetical protein [Bryobacterales bacterium]
MNQDWDRLCEELRAATEPSDEAVAELHRRVLARTRRRPAAAWVGGLAAAAVLLAVLLWPPALETLALERPSAPVAPSVSFTPKPPPPRVRPALVRDREAAWIRIETPDPDVVILLVADTGDAE